MGYGRVNPHKNKVSNRVPIIFMLGGFILGLVLLIVGIASENADAGNNNVKTGSVRVTGYIDKICDGPNLVYTVYGNGLTVSPNDTQCK